MKRNVELWSSAKIGCIKMKKGKCNGKEKLDDTENNKSSWSADDRG